MENLNKRFPEKEYLKLSFILNRLERHKDIINQLLDGRSIQKKYFDGDDEPYIKVDQLIERFPYGLKYYVSNHGKDYIKSNDKIKHNYVPVELVRDFFPEIKNKIAQLIRRNKLSVRMKDNVMEINLNVLNKSLVTEIYAIKINRRSGGFYYRLYQKNIKGNLEKQKAKFVLRKRQSIPQSDVFDYLNQTKSKAIENNIT